MTNYRYLGYGVTNSNGVAHLDHDPQGNLIDGYTGTGAGEVDVLASLDNPIDEGSIVSETYSIIDALYFDDMSTNTHANYYLNTANNSISYSNQKLIITALNNNGMYVDIRTLLDTVKGKTVKFKVDVEPSDCECQLVFYPKGSPQEVSDWTSTATTLTSSTIEVPSDATNGFFRINTRNITTGSSFAFKNFAIWID